MASIRQRSGVWQARVRRKGFPDEVNSFATKAEAQMWARCIESLIDKGTHFSLNQSKDWLLTDVLERYMQEVTPSKRGAKREAEGIRFMQRQKMAAYSMERLTPSVIANYRDERLKSVSAGTIIRELSILSGIITHARKEWSLSVANPCALVRKPPTPQGRCRLLNTNEESRLLAELRPIGRRNRWMTPLVILALETAMRRGELLALRWENVHLQHQTAFLPMTKNGTGRTVPLSKKAVAVLAELPRASDARVFPLTDMAMHAAFRKACARAHIVDLHFHDLRHTATSRLAEKLPNVIELAAVTGHQTIQMLKRYYHPKAEVLAQKLG
ncbi:site-specific integrase [Paraherbaspirillum soli]|uniref:Site-specific integrase n=1 Tax=Paraherbaspirillum soli TaxID=631222 RepID=A0ABW0MBL8_9BURK